MWKLGGWAHKHSCVLVDRSLHRLVKIKQEQITWSNYTITQVQSTRALFPSHLYVNLHCFLIEGNVNKLHPKVMRRLVESRMDANWGETAKNDKNNVLSLKSSLRATSLVQSTYHGKKWSRNRRFQTCAFLFQIVIPVTTVVGDFLLFSLSATKGKRRRKKTSKKQKRVRLTQQRKRHQTHRHIIA